MDAKIGKKGFTLIELLIVIGIIAILAAVVLLTLNPAELLRQARDSTRVSDLDATRSALSLYLADVSNPNLGDTAWCYAATSTTAYTFSAACRRGVHDQVRVAGLTAITSSTVTATNSRNVNGTGWIPVDLTQISAGAPLPAFPVDPTNSDLYYYVYKPGAQTTYELNANMESKKFLPNEDGDGGNATNIKACSADYCLNGSSNDGLYEIGTSQGLAL